MLYHHEPIVCNEEIKGFLTSGSYGHTLGASVGLGYVKSEEGVNADMLAANDWAVEVGGLRIPATPSLQALYDPKGVIMRG